MKFDEILEQDTKLRREALRLISEGEKLDDANQTEQAHALYNEAIKVYPRIIYEYGMEYPPLPSPTSYRSER